MNRALQEYFATEGSYINAALEDVLAGKNLISSELQQAMHYAVFPGGKRIRPVLTLAVTQALAGPRDIAIFPSIAVELIHSYSLIHDDLPCMDDDDLRRGKPTVHRKFGEAIALLAGDALLTKAFEIISEMPGDGAVTAKILRVVSQAAGASGMVGGQVLDMYYEQNPAAGEAQLLNIHRLKTGALLAASCQCGGIVSCCDEERLRQIANYGELIGLAFQIADDVLDFTGESEKTGKTMGKDAAADKLTFVKLFGVDEARRRGTDAVETAFECLRKAEITQGILFDLGKYIVERDW
jgi:geranylgeranyl diphosphate synthase type II